MARAPSPRSRSRRWLRIAAAAALLLAALVLSAPWWVPTLIAGTTRAPGGLLGALDEPQRARLSELVRDLEGRPVVDVHVHVAGIGTGGSGCWVNPSMRSWLHPIEALRFRTYLAAGGVRELERADEQYVERLVELARAAPLRRKHYVLAFDRRYREDGTLDLDGSALYVPNEHAWELAQRYPDVMAPAMSVHPYRADAAAEVERWARRGVKLLKWLPNAMGIDPASPRCDAFYDALARNDVVLLSHAGAEYAMRAGDGAELGNPQRLRRALERGVVVIVAHCASLGSNSDLDEPSTERRASFDLFIDMLADPRWEGRLYGELSAVAQVNRPARTLATLLRRTELHERLVDGTDYPLPAIDALVHLWLLERRGFLSEEDVALLRTVHEHDPLFFDLALKRALRAPETGERFAASIFRARERLGL